MINCFYNKFGINILAIILALLIVFVSNFLFEKVWSKDNISNSINIDSLEIVKEETKKQENIEDNKDLENEKEVDILNKIDKSMNELNSENKVSKKESAMLKQINEDEIIYNKKWYLEIKKIDLIAEISEGTEESVLDEYIGHFSETPVNVGNVGLAAHNRGYKNNYFSRLKELEIGDKIYYYINGHKFEYEVLEILIIYETDWDKLKDTKDNRITMITCVENREKYRLCIQAKRVKEE